MENSISFGKYAKTIDNFQLILYVIFFILWFISSKLPSLRLLSIILLGLFCIIQVAKIVTRKQLSFNKPICAYVLFFIWGLLSTIWAENASAAIDKSIDLICNSVLMLLSYDYFQNTSISRKKFVSIFITIGLLFSVYIIGYYGIGNYFSKLVLGKRIGEEIINVNFIGVVSSITLLLMLYSIINKLFNKRLVIVALSILPFITALGSGSKKVLLGLAVGITVIFILHFKNKITAKKIVATLITILAIMGIIMLSKSQPVFNTVFRRVDAMIMTFDNESSTEEGSTIKRQQFIQSGMETFLNHPLTGIGLNNSGKITKEIIGEETYLHCNYVEILACLGIIGFIIYYSIYIYIFLNALRKKERRNTAIVITMIIVFVVIEIGCVTYYEIKTAMYLTMMYVLIEKNNWLEADNQRKKNRSTNEEQNT